MPPFPTFLDILPISYALSNFKEPKRHERTHFTKTQLRRARCFPSTPCRKASKPLRNIPESTSKHTERFLNLEEFVYITNHQKTHVKYTQVCVPSKLSVLKYINERRKDVKLTEEKMLFSSPSQTGCRRFHR